MCYNKSRRFPRPKKEYTGGCESIGVTAAISANAACNLFAATLTDGVRSKEEINAMMKQYERLA